jgi:hypothetical protein
LHDAVRGTLLVDTARTQAFAGFKQDRPPALKNVELALQSAFGVVIVSSLDDQPLMSSKHVLVSALGNAVNRGMALAAGRDRVQNPGSSPVLVEPIIGQLKLARLTARGRAKVYALGPNGERDHAVDAQETPDSLSFGMAAEHHTMHYEITRD